jgi:hypothetical protein
MTYEVAESKGYPGEWRVEAINMEGDGECYVTLFCGPLAQERAREYAALKMSQLFSERARPQLVSTSI